MATLSGLLVDTTALQVSMGWELLRNNREKADMAYQCYLKGSDRSNN